MTEEKWQQLLQKVNSQFTVLDSGLLAGDVPGAETEFIEWEMPNSQMRAEYHRRPKLLDRKTHYSKRIGGEVTEEAVYSEDESVRFVKFFSRSLPEEPWQEISLGDFA